MLTKFNPLEKQEIFSLQLLKIQSRILTEL